MSRTPLSRQDAFGERGIASRVTPFEGFSLADPEPRILGMKNLAREAFRPDLERGRWPGQRNFIRAVVTVNDQRVLNPERVQSLGDRAQVRNRGHAHDLPPHPGRVREWADEVEDRTKTEFPTQRGQLPEGRVVPRCEQEPETGLRYAPGGDFGGSVDPNAQRFEHIGTATTAAHRAVPVFRHPCTAGGGHEPRESRDVYGLKAIPSGAAGVDEAVGGEWKRRRAFAKGAREAQDFSAVLAADPQGAQQAPGLGGRNIAGHQGEGRLAGITLGEGPVDGFVEQR